MIAGSFAVALGMPARMIGPVATNVLDLAPRPADVRLRYGDHPSQFVDLYRPAGDGPFPVAVLVHGGYYRAAYGLEHMSHLAWALRTRGVASWSLEYRRLGEAGGAGWPGTFLDIAAGADALRAAAARHALDPGRVLAMGFSAGGHLALWLAARHRIPAGDPLYSPAPLVLRGAISLAGVLDLRRGSELGLSGGVIDRLLGGTPDAVPHRLATASPYELLPLGLRQLLIHGALDDLVPPELSRRYAERATAYGDPIELIELPETGHFEPIDTRLLQGIEVVGQVERMLRGLEA
jgi:acetyl esterase/lipase